IKRLKMVAIGIGDTLLAKTQEMALIADKSLNARTVGALKEINNSMFILIATIILALFIGLLISVRLTEGITKPISELVNATRIIESGELGYTISYQDDTEFGELARNFNRMSIALKEGYENIYRQQQMIQESEWKFRTLSEFTNDWEYWIDGHRKIVFMSASCERITGYSPEEFSESPRLLYDIVHDEDRAAYETHMADFTATRHEEMEFRIITKSGQLKWISHVCGPIYVEERFLGRRVSNRDITDRKKLEEQLSQSQKMESLGLLAGGIAHDFNNLLTSITGYSSLLESELGDGDARTKRFVSQILSASERAQNLTSSLLAFSRKQIMKPSMVSLNGVVENISGLLRSLIGEDIELIISCSAEEFPIFADPHQIEQVIMNLVTNARDAMPTGGRLAIGTTPVTLSSEFAGKYGAKPGRYMVLSVSDTGMGIEAKDLPHIFDPFFTTKEKNKGTGLGLAMVYGVIKQHGGFIDVYTEKGWGTTFKIYQPASAEDRSDGQTVRAVPETAIDFRGNETIFIAEDDGAVREFMRDVLERYGYKVLMALDGVDAIRKYTEYKDSIDMVILDVVMPRKNGKEVYDHIKSMSPGLKALFMSGYTQDILTSRGIYEENLEFISKPLEINTLMLKVRNILSSSAHGP
ncbi:MAG TPA: ATP-binding protein, partial [Dissulfurispiraceae bacterium]